MHPEIFESGIISSILAWASALPLMIYAIAWVFISFAKQEGIPRWFSVWMALCLFIFSPVRYMLFLVVASDCYLMQSWGAFFSSFILALYVPIIFGLLFFIGLLPVYLLIPILNKTSGLTVVKGCLVSILLPVACILCSFVFYWMLPYAGSTVHWLNAKDIIRATNGPTSIVYRYFSSIGTPIFLPKFYDQTPQQPIDELRCHVASIFLNEFEKGYFVKYQYPELFKRLTTDVGAK